MLVDFNNKQYETNIEPYLEHCFIVARVPTNIFEYILLIAELPTSENEKWLFEVEYGLNDGHAETHDWQLSDKLKEYLKVEILDHILKTKDKRFYKRDFDAKIENYDKIPMFEENQFLYDTKTGKLYKAEKYMKKLLRKK